MRFPSTGIRPVYVASVMARLSTAIIPQRPEVLYPVTWPITEKGPSLHPSASYAGGMTTFPFESRNPIFPSTSNVLYVSARPAMQLKMETTSQSTTFINSTNIGRMRQTWWPCTIYPVIQAFCESTAGTQGGGRGGRSLPDLSG